MSRFNQRDPDYGYSVSLENERSSRYHIDDRDVEHIDQAYHDTTQLNQAKADGIIGWNADVGDYARSDQFGNAPNYENYQYNGAQQNAPRYHRSTVNNPESKRQGCDGDGYGFREVGYGTAGSHQKHDRHWEAASTMSQRGHFRLQEPLARQQVQWNGHENNFFIGPPPNDRGYQHDHNQHISRYNQHEVFGDRQGVRDVVQDMGSKYETPIPWHINGNRQDGNAEEFGSQFLTSVSGHATGNPAETACDGRQQHLVRNDTASDWPMQVPSGGPPTTVSVPYSQHVHSHNVVFSGATNLHPNAYNVGCSPPLHRAAAVFMPSTHVGTPHSHVREPYPQEIQVQSAAALVPHVPPRQPISTWSLTKGAAARRGMPFMHAPGKSVNSSVSEKLTTPIGTCVRFAPGASSLAVGGDRTTHIYSTTRNSFASDMATPGGASECFTRSCCFSPRGKHVLVGSEDGCIRVWSHESHRIVHEFRGHSVDVACVDTCSNAWPKFVSGSADATTRIWDVDTGKCVTSYPSPDGSAIAAVATEPRGNVHGVATAQGTVALYDGRMDGVLGLCHGHTGGVFSLAFAPNGAMASASVDGSLRMWQGTCATNASHEHAGMVLACTFSADGAWLVSGGGDGVVRFYEPSTMDCVWELTGDQSFGPIVDVAMAGRLVAIANGSDQAKLFEVVLQQVRVP